MAVHLGIANRVRREDLQSRIRTRFLDARQGSSQPLLIVQDRPVSRRLASAAKPGEVVHARRADQDHVRRWHSVLWFEKLVHHVAQNRHVKEGLLLIDHCNDHLDFAHPRPLSLNVNHGRICVGMRVPEYLSFVLTVSTACLGILLSVSRNGISAKNCLRTVESPIMTMENTPSLTE